MTWQPILFYAALVALIALPLAAVSRVSGVVCLVFVTAFVMVNGIGADQVWTYFALHLLAFWATIATARTPSGLFASVVFGPMAVVDGIRLLGVITEYRWAWAIYFAAMFQLALLGGMMDRGAVLSGPRHWLTHLRDLWMRFTAPAVA